MPKGIYEHKKGWHHFKETKRKIGLANKGKHIWKNKIHPNLGKHYSKIIKEKISQALKETYEKGRITWNKGMKFPQYSRENSPVWKGGIKKRPDGYIQILNPAHPFCNKTGHIYEHRLVMEKYLGRYLEPQETVHHINGNHSDNRIENLKLFANKSIHSSLHMIGNQRAKGMPPNKTSFKKGIIPWIKGKKKGIHF
jgi:hypothetical protein